MEGGRLSLYSGGGGGGDAARDESPRRRRKSTEASAKSEGILQKDGFRKSLDEAKRVSIADVVGHSDGQSGSVNRRGSMHSEVHPSRGGGGASASSDGKTVIEYEDKFDGRRYRVEVGAPGRSSGHRDTSAVRHDDDDDDDDWSADSMAGRKTNAAKSEDSNIASTRKGRSAKRGDVHVDDGIDAYAKYDDDGQDHDMYDPMGDYPSAGRSQRGAKGGKSRIPVPVSGSVAGRPKHGEKSVYANTNHVKYEPKRPTISTHDEDMSVMSDLTNFSPRYKNFPYASPKYGVSQDREGNVRNKDGTRVAGSIVGSGSGSTGSSGPAKDPKKKSHIWRKLQPIDIAPYKPVPH
jgi:hypothetical protein